eukprot:TRINITY_DN111468_c0_g1_i1.p1 TRINITY_DN111468_c0_g1~~TRINITY_DN111468_c0_g1_i1.p1  ORF type:complete len:291 (-),score=28.16 TRINITY_DN111468_c0_g1_i1:113-985(-)
MPKFFALLLLLPDISIHAAVCKKTNLVLLQISRHHSTPSRPWYRFPEEPFYWGKYDNFTGSHGACTPSCGHPVIVYNYADDKRWSEDYAPLGNPRCGLGGRQSPIDIQTRAVVALRDNIIDFSYQTVSDAAVINNGHYLEVDGEFGTLQSQTQGSSVYKAMNYHVHAPSEHRVDGRSYAMELHVVHKRSTSDPDDSNEHYFKGSAVGLLFNIGNETNPCVKNLLNPLPSVSCSACIGELDLSTCFQEQLTGPYYNYDGSVTTPPCSERMEWFVMARPATITQETIATCSH